MKNVAISARTAAYGADTLIATSNSNPANGSEAIGTRR